MKKIIQSVYQENYTMIWRKERHTYILKSDKLNCITSNRMWTEGEMKTYQQAYH